MQEGDQIENGRYRVEKLLGQGGMGQVYRGVDTLLNKTVAIKVLFPNTPDAVIKRFHAEAVALAALSHPNILTVHQFGQAENGQLYLVMDFIKGESLATMIEKRGPQTFYDVLPIFEKICRGLRYAHNNGVLHRDIKPSNVMLSNDKSQEGSVKLVDFGLAKVADKDFELTKTGTAMGSPPYMSPEAVRGTDSDERSDIYSLGCTFFEMMVGVPPLVGDNPLHTMMAHLHRLPPTLAEASGKRFDEEVELFVQKCIKKDPKDRFQNMDALIKGLNEVKAALQSKKETSLGALASGVYASGSFLANKVFSADRKILGIGSVLAVVILGCVGLAIFAICSWKEPEPVVPLDDALVQLGQAVEKPETRQRMLEQTDTTEGGVSIIDSSFCADKTCFIAGRIPDEELMKAVDKHRDMKSFKLSELSCSDNCIKSILALPDIECLQISEMELKPFMRDAIVRMLKLHNLRFYKTGDLPVGFIEKFGTTGGAALIDRAVSTGRADTAGRAGPIVRAGSTDKADSAEKISSLQLTGLEFEPGKNYPHPGSALARIKSLSLLILYDCKLSRADVREIASGLHLNIFGLIGGEIADDEFADLKLASRCTALTLVDVDLKPRHFSDIAQMPMLAFLDLHGTNTTDEDLRNFRHCGSLKRLILNGTKVSETGVAVLRASRPDTEITFGDTSPAFKELY